MPENDTDVTQSDDNGGSPAPANATGTDKVNWQDKYNGLQGHANKLKSKVDSLTLELARVREESEGQISNLTVERDTFKVQADNHQKTLGDVTKERDTLKARRELGKTIRAKYPTLVDLYEDDLLPGIEGMDDEARTSYLDRYSAKLTTLTEAGVVDNVKGSVPPPANGTQHKGNATTLQDATKALQDAMRQHGPRSQQYAAAMQAYQAMLMNPANQ